MFHVEHPPCKSGPYQPKNYLKKFKNCGVMRVMSSSKETKYQKLAGHIRSNKLSTKEVMTEFESDPEFALWYKNTYKKKLYTYP